MQRKFQPRGPQYAQRINQRIRVREVRVIDSNGEQLGVLPTPQAIARAQSQGLDLVEVSPNAQPPVCKIIDYGKFRYETAKREKEAKKHNLSAKVKELKFHINIDEHDYMVKMRHAEDFLMRGLKVKLMLVLRGREMMRKDDGREMAGKIKTDLLHVAVADQDPKLVGRNINMMLTPLPANKRKRKFTEEGGEYEDVIEEENQQSGEDEES